MVPYVFAQPAKDLVSALRPPAEGILLDVGTGTGVCATVARQRIAPAGTVIGVDPSLGMLRLAKREGLVVAGVVPELPFRDGMFDAVLASFVLSHFRSYQTAMLDMARILKPGGKLGVTTWRLDKSDCRQLWQETAESFVGKEELARASREALPWEEWFSDVTHVKEALEMAGLATIEMERRDYSVNMPVSDFLAVRDISIQARFVRERLGVERWQHFRETMAKRFYTHFGEIVEDVRQAYIAVGAKPSSSM
ncbi:MAG TPA: methyltransferase domain-containing protein [Terriglobales bacterium]|nr:methyltransferase domain-containing protein [Terriglobales bacterium]